MSWICDNENDLTLMECQKEIRRLRGVVRELQEQQNSLTKRAIWKDKKVVGYINLTDQQVDAFNIIEDIGIYIGFDKVTKPEAYEGAFEFNGYHFVPERKLTVREDNFRVISSKIFSEHTLGMATYDFDWVKIPWNYEKFYEASTDKEADLFRCVENNLLYLPGENELFGWRE